MPEVICNYYPDFFKMPVPVKKPPPNKLLSKTFAKDNMAAAYKSTAKIVSKIKNKKFTSALHENSPELQGYNWVGYLESSIIRIAFLTKLLKKYGHEIKTICDFGSYFGNFSLAAGLLGYETTAMDCYETYGENFTEITQLLNKKNVKIMDSSEETRRSQSQKYDAVFLMGVIEHIPHTPRFLLEDLKSLLRPGGILFMDTPNLAYHYRRQQLMSGKTIFPDIKQQFYTSIPYMGHHREYTLEEMIWMQEQLGLKVEHVEMFNFSYYSCDYFTQDIIDGLKVGYEDKTQRELIMTAAKKM